MAVSGPSLLGCIHTQWFLMAPCQDDNNNRSLDVFLTASHRYHSLPMCIQSRMWNLFFTDKKNRMKQNPAWWKKATCNAWLFSLSLSYSLFFIITIWSENFTLFKFDSIFRSFLQQNWIFCFWEEGETFCTRDDTSKMRNSLFIRSNLYPLFKSRIDLVERVHNTMTCFSVNVIVLCLSDPLVPKFQMQISFTSKILGSLQSINYPRSAKLSLQRKRKRKFQPKAKGCIKRGNFCSNQNCDHMWPLSAGLHTLVTSCCFVTWGNMAPPLGQGLLHFDKMFCLRIFNIFDQGHIC